MFCIFNTMGAADLITQLLFEIRLRHFIVIKFYIKCNNICERKSKVNYIVSILSNERSTFNTIDDVAKMRESIENCF